MNKKLREERADIEGALQTAVERGARIARYRERTGHNGGTSADKPSFGALKHAETKIHTESVIHGLHLAYEQHGVSDDRFKGALYGYLQVLNATWYQDSHAALSEHRNDMVTELYIKMTDPANSDCGASIYTFKGAVPVHHFINSVFKTFFLEKDRKQRDHDFQHFRLVDDSESASPVGDVRMGQLDKLAFDPTPPSQKPMNPATLSSLGPAARNFMVEFESRSDAHLLIMGWLRKDADLSATKMAQMLRTMTSTILNGDGEVLRVIEPMEVHQRTVQRIKKAFFEGVHSISENHYREKDPATLAQKVYRSVMARAGKPVRRHPVETKKSRSDAQKADPNYVEKTFKDGPKFGGSRKRTNMDSDVDKDAGKIIS
jgi:hypothetical protein